MFATYDKITSIREFRQSKEKHLRIDFYATDNLKF